MFLECGLVPEVLNSMTWHHKGCVVPWFCREINACFRFHNEQSAQHINMMLLHATIVEVLEKIAPDLVGNPHLLFQDYDGVKFLIYCPPKLAGCWIMWFAVILKCLAWADCNRGKLVKITTHDDRYAAE